LINTLGLAVAFIAATAAIVIAAGPPIIPKADRKFDHDKHAQIMTAQNKKADCASCHKVDAGGKAMGTDHQRCDNAGCHNLDHDMQNCDFVKVAGPKSPARQCQICHVATRKECLPNDLPALSSTKSYVPTFQHATHLKLGGIGQQQCASCHTAEAGPAPTDPHMSCSGDPKSPNHKTGCHADSANPTQMNKCGTCHVDRANAPKAPPNDAYSVAKVFNHDKHNLKRNMTQCALCHQAIATAPEGTFPKPQMATCGTGGCHDGKAAFPAFGTSCTKCHTGTDAAVKAMPGVGFSHASHAKRNVNINDCAQCHELKPDGTLQPPGTNKNHAPCANSGCHQTEFASRQTKICGSCHTESAPWLHAVARLPERSVAAGGPIPEEWFETTNHAVHIKKLGPTNATCEGCHGSKLENGAMQRDHKACAPCHGKNQPPSMNDCQMCHKNQAIARAGVSDWSVSRTFAHSVHATDPRNKQPAACIGCHASVATATDLTSIKPPTMASCDGCHDGRSAFKTTGFECARCHTKGAQAATAPMAPKVTMLEPRR
jgi:c(7)-type cytochrome triheme protein